MDASAIVMRATQYRPPPVRVLVAVAAILGWPSWVAGVDPGRMPLSRDITKVWIDMGAWFAVAVGGALGSMGRFWLASAMTALTGPRFPWGTLLINVLGSFVIGLIGGITLTPERVPIHPNMRIFLMTGVCGGFTTFSAFSLQTLELMQAGEPIPALGYAIGSVVLCVIASYCGWLLGRF